LADDEFPPTFPGLAKMIGISPESIGGGECTVSTVVQNEHLNAGGVAHGGLHATMLDTALGGALVSALSKEEWCATAEIDVSYIRPAIEGDTLEASGRVVKRGKNLAHMEGEIIDHNGRLIATAKGTWAIWIPSGPGRPGNRR
tara:strand:+ start:4132 stop:4560 length:429 start_codon:yes stop_codon:yes gene_type:complete